MRWAVDVYESTYDKYAVYSRRRVGCQLFDYEEEAREYAKAYDDPYGDVKAKVRRAHKDDLEFA